MRKSTWLAALALALAAASTGRAQQFATSQGTNPVNTANSSTFMPSNPAGSLMSTQNIHSGPSGLFSWLPKLSPFNERKQINTSVFPQEKDQPGLKYLQGFGYRKAKVAQ